MSEILRYCQLAQRMGYSRSAALREYRRQGYKIRTERFVEIWSAAKASRQLAGEPHERCNTGQ